MTLAAPRGNPTPREAQALLLFLLYPQVPVLEYWEQLRLWTSKEVLEDLKRALESSKGPGRVQAA